jgi:steroid 5-alpha reductase family enzyme
VVTTVGKGESLLRVTIAYVVAFAAGAAWLVVGPDTGRLWLDGLLADLVATLVVFGASRLHRNSSFYDAYWSVLPPFLVAYWWVAAQADGDVRDARNGLVLVVIVVWAVRLTGNWVYAFPGLHHEDWRYPQLRERAGRFELLADLFGTHVIPTIQVFLGLLPVYVAVTAPGRPVGWLDAVAVVVGLGATLLTFVADGQMYRFARTKQPGQALDQGLWAWSRHPNYFGEWLFWVSLLLFGLAASPGDWWWLWIGVGAMLAMFQGASIPMMEERSLERRPAYQDVIDRVPRFVPRPPRRRTGAGV